MPLKHSRAIFISFIIVALLCPTFLLSQKIPIAVLDFEANGISQSEVIALTDRLRTELFRTERYRIIERGMMADILQEQDFQMSGCTSSECAVEIGRLIGVSQIVGGSISRIGTMYSVTARIVDVETGEFIHTVVYDHEGAINELMIFGMKNIAQQLAGFNVSVPELPQPRPAPRAASDQLAVKAGKINRITFSWAPVIPASHGGIVRGYLFSEPQDRHSARYLSICYTLYPWQGGDESQMQIVISLGYLNHYSSFGNINAETGEDEIYDEDRTKTIHLLPAIHFPFTSKKLGIALFGGAGIAYADNYDRFHEREKKRVGFGPIYTAGLNLHTIPQSGKMPTISLEGRWLFSTGPFDDATLMLILGIALI